MSFKIENGVMIGWFPEEGETVANIPDGVTEIGEWAFDHKGRRARVVEEVTIPDSVEYIRYGAFNGCQRLKEIHFGNGVKHIEARAFSFCGSLTHVTLPDSVETVDAEAFGECDALESVTFGKGLKSIGSMAFWRCHNLKSVTFPGGITIRDDAFWDCWALEKAEFPDGAAMIGEHAFWKCTRLDRVPVIALDGKVFYNQDPHGHVPYETISDLVINHNYSVRMQHPMKFDMICQILRAGTDTEGVCAYIKKNLAKMFEFLAQKGDAETFALLLENGGIITKRNVDKYIQMAAEYGQKKMADMLTVYKTEQLG